ncbi:MAG: hypothetical protein ACOC3I_11675 [Verrucomicrobiota bacterium]
MKTWHLVVALLAMNYLLWFFAVAVDQMLAPLSLALHLEALFVAFPALCLPILPSLWILLGLSLLLGAQTPVPVGGLLLGFALLWHAGVWLRTRVQAPRAVHFAVLAGVGQFCFILAWTLYLAPNHPAPEALWLRALTEALLSGGLVAALAYPWCRLQAGILEEFGWQAPAP